MKKIFVVDWTLLAAILLTVVTGVGVHVSGHSASHRAWEVWAWLHSIAGLSFAGFAVWHVKMHAGWYKALIKRKPSRKKRHVTAVLTVVAFVVSLTGVAMFGIKGANSGIGLWHYRLGFVLVFLGIAHLAKRFPVLRKQ